ncbi:MAG: DUF4810 domain-containing protein [Bacteroidales bacterium]
MTTFASPYKTGVIVSLFLTIGLFSSCETTKPMYYWDDYMSASYNYYKKQRPEDTEKLVKTFENIIRKSNNSTRQIAPPGIYAEYGFLLIQTGKKEEGMAMLHKEIEAYPESKSFIERIIKQAEQ